MSADFTPKKEDYKILTPFKMQVLTNFPYIEADFDALTNYQLLCKVVEYLNAVIHNENEVTEQVTGLYNAYISLQNYVNTYFDSLDLQSIVDNKLDEMAEDGTLADMIAEYIKMQGQLVYNNVEEMKAAENIQNGSFLKTYGRSLYNDGGGALYKARTVTNEDVIDNMFIIALHDNTLVAELVVYDNTINILQCGAVIDDEDIDNSLIINSINEKGYNAFIPEGKFYCSTSVNINIENGKIFGVSTKSCLAISPTFEGDELLLIYAPSGDYYSREDRIKNVENLHLLGTNDKDKIGLKCGGDNETTEEGQVDCVQYNNLKITKFNKAIYANSHFYRDVFINVITDDCNYSLYYDENATDTGESTNFIACSLWSGSLYIRNEVNFIGCTLHFNVNKSIEETNCYCYCYNANIVNFTNCHFESLGTNEIDNVFIADRTPIYFNNCIFLVTPTAGMTINDSYFKTIQSTNPNSGNVAQIEVKDSTMKYLLTRITAGTNFIFAKGNVNIYTNTVYKDDNSTIGYKIYDYTTNFYKGDVDIEPFIITEAYKDGGAVTVSDNTMTFATPTATSTNSFGVYKKYYVGNHRAGHIVIDNLTCSSTVPHLVYKYNTDAVNSIKFYNKNGERIAEYNTTSSTDNAVASFAKNSFFNIPEDCEYILFGYGGYGLNYQYPVTITAGNAYIEFI